MYTFSSAIECTQFIANNQSHACSECSAVGHPIFVAFIYPKQYSECYSLCVTELCANICSILSTNKIAHVSSFVNTQHCSYICPIFDSLNDTQSTTHLNSFMCPICSPELGTINNSVNNTKCLANSASFKYSQYITFQCANWGAFSGTNIMSNTSLKCPN